MSNREIHYRYAIAFLLAGIVLLVAFAYYEVPELVDKFSFALTLSSLLLAILAIFYTIISGARQSSQIEKIIEANAGLTTAVRDIRTASEEISSLTHDMPRQFTSIHSKIDSLSNSYQNLPQIKSESEPENGNKSTSRRTDTDLKTFMQYLGRVQYASMAALYLFDQFGRNGKPIDPSIFEELNVCPQDYAVGALSGFSSTGLIAFTVHKGEIVPTHCASVVRNHLKDQLIKIRELTKKEKSKDFLETAMKNIEKYLNN